MTSAANQDLLRTILKKPAVEAAPLLLGWLICRDTPAGTIKLRLVETEAYHQDDPASHSHKWRTARTAPMFKAGGHLYVYFTYGMHYAINIVTGKEGVGEAVLLRAAEPLEGLHLMMRNRQTKKLINIANGPGKLTQALGIKDTKFSGRLLGRRTIYLEPPMVKVKAKEILTSPRVGITKAVDVPWRFYLKASPYVSKAVYNKH